MLSQIAVFTQTVREHMDPPRVVVAATASCVEVVQCLRETQASAAIIVNAALEPVGILTEQDVTRRIAFQVGPDTPVLQVMSEPVSTVQARDFLHHAVAWMRRDGIRHLPVVDDRRVVGLLELDQVLARLSGQTVSQIDRLSHWANPKTMEEAKHNQERIAAELLADAVPAVDIQQLLSRLDHQIYHDAVDYCLGLMEREGWGSPPVAFEVLVMGSSGRGESSPWSDQDNGLILEDYPDREHYRIDSWFVAFSERLTATLNAIGFEYCHGHVMATNPLWRKTLSQWRAQVSGWIRKSEGLALRLSDILFDFACVYGEGRLSRALREHITQEAARPIFLRELFKVDEEHEVALGPFGIFLTERRHGLNHGKLNLKITGTLPLVGAIRILALAHGIPKTGTLERIAALHERGALSHNQQDALSHAYRHIVQLLLRQQLRDRKAGLTPGSYVSPRALSRREIVQLKANLKAIKEFRANLRADLTGELF
jgi:CBS domain-containing protein